MFRQARLDTSGALHHMVIREIMKYLRRQREYYLNQQPDFYL